MPQRRQNAARPLRVHVVRGRETKCLILVMRALIRAYLSVFQALIAQRRARYVGRCVVRPAGLRLRLCIATTLQLILLPTRSLWLTATATDVSPCSTQKPGRTSATLGNRSVVRFRRAAQPESQQTRRLCWPRMGRWLLPFICRAKACRQSRCCIRPGRQCLPRSSRYAIRAEGSVP